MSNSYTVETYNKHGQIERTEIMRTLSWAEFKFELDRAQLPVADVELEVTTWVE